MKNASITILVTCGLLLLVNAASSQKVIRLVEYTNVWVYHEAGTDPGSTWMERTFDDSGWLSGSGLFGVETNLPPPYPVPLNTPLLLGEPRTAAFYFRTRFNLPEIPAALEFLRATLYADDGCVVFLNGLEVARLRVPTNQNHQTFTIGTAGGSSPPYEGASDKVDLALAALVPGENVLAVEVHQETVGSSDIVWGMKLRAEVAEPIVFLRQPAGAKVAAGGSHTMGVEVGGGPVRYQWFKDGAAISAATNQTLAFANIQTDATGAYQVVASNYHGARWSEPAVVSLSPSAAGDLTGPRVVSATVRLLGFTNNIDVTYSKPIVPGRGSYVVRRVSDESMVFLTNVLTAGSVARLRVGGPAWSVSDLDAYYITISDVSDLAGRRIAPGTQVPVTRTFLTNVISTNALWRYHAFPFEDPSILEAVWWRPGFAENGYWRTGAAPFHASGNLCMGDVRTEIPDRAQPTFFRTTFDWPGHLPLIGDMVVNLAVGEGLVVYVNGDEVFRGALPSAPTELDLDTRSTGLLGCGERTFSNVRLRAGVNELNCAVYRGNGAPLLFGRQSYFALAARINYGVTPVLPEPPAPVLRADWVSPTEHVFWWVGPGFALESTTNLSLGSGSQPFGPWLEVTNMSNPYTNVVSPGSERFFRLKR